MGGCACVAIFAAAVLSGCGNSVTTKTAEYLTIELLKNLDFLSKEAKIGLTVAIIIAVVAVLLINIEIIAVVVIKPNKIKCGFLPNFGSNRFNKSSSSLVFFIPFLAKKKPPKNSQITPSDHVWYIAHRMLVFSSVPITTTKYPYNQNAD